ncbi:hypothetical protein AHF37_12363 [Paragonimus kellicotti]|nr:hypothetical protein AHF37_12363 [Paragonimus kellicotti]
MSVTGYQLPLNIIQTQPEQHPSMQPTTISTDLGVLSEKRNSNQQPTQCAVSVDSTGATSHDTAESESISQFGWGAFYEHFERAHPSHLDSDFWWTQSSRRSCLQQVYFID